MREVAPIRVTTDWQVAQDARETIVHEWEFEGTLDVALSVLTRAHGLLPIFGADEVLVTRPEYAHVATVERWHLITPELLAAVTRFIPPTIQLVGPDSVTDEDIGWGCEELEPVLPYGEPYGEDDIDDFVRSAVHPECWNIRGFSAERVGSSLCVRCSPRIQRAVGKFLETLARSARADEAAPQPHQD